METIVTVLMIVIGFNFLLKLSFNKVLAVVAVATIAALFVGMMWPQAILQSKMQITNWLHNTDLMLDISVILTVEVVLNMAYCMLSAHIGATGKVKRKVIWGYRILRWFPGFAIFPVLFSALVYIIFALPGYQFSTIAWSLAVVIFFGVILLVWGIKELLYEKELRLELLFLTNILIAVLGIIATVNGRTAMQGQSSVDISALAGILAIILLSGVVGAQLQKIKMKRLNNK